jgi:hypothetical protein
VAASVAGSRRTAYTENGGGRHHPKDDPEHLWIDAYCGIKTSTVNAMFVCHVRRPATTPNFNCVSTVYALGRTTPAG